MTAITRIVLADWDNTFCRGYTVVPWTAYLEAAGLFRNAERLRTLLDDAHRGAFPTYDGFCEEMATAYAAGIMGSASRGRRS